MSHVSLLLTIVGVIIAIVLVAAMVFQRIHRRDQVAKRIAMVARGGIDLMPVLPGRTESQYVYVLRLIGQLLSNSGVLPQKSLLEIEQTLNIAGFRQESALSVFIGAKIVSMALLPLLIFLLMNFLPHIFGTNHMVGSVVGLIIGLILPDFIVSRLRKGRLARTELGLPDALDMLIICSEAGLGLEAGIERVSVEIEAARPEIAAEFGIISAELRMTSDRSVALKNMGTRTGIESMKRLGVTLIQTMQYGTPLTEALRVLSSEMRHEFLMRFETRAARLPVLLTLPMIVFILPCVFFVVGGPAFVGIHNLSSAK